MFEHDAHSLRFAYDDLTPFMERNHLLLLLGHAKKFRTIISHKRIKTTRKSSVAAIKMCNARISWNYASGGFPGLFQLRLTSHSTKAQDNVIKTKKNEQFGDTRLSDGLNQGLNNPNGHEEVKKNFNLF